MTIDRRAGKMSRTHSVPGVMLGIYRPHPPILHDCTERSIFVQTNYREINSTAYSLSTSGRVIDVLEHARDKRKQRLRIFYGNTDTGLDHGATEAICGYVGRTSGEIKRPVLLARTTSPSGIAVNDDEIVKIMDTKTKRVLYRHKNFHQPHIEIRRYRDPTHPWRLCFFRPNDSNHFSTYETVAFAETPFRTLREAHNRLRFHTGQRMTP